MLEYFQRHVRRAEAVAQKVVVSGRMPVSKSIPGFQPRAKIRVLSISLRGVPSGLVVSQMISPAKPTMRRTSSASALIVSSEPEPTLMICSSL